MTWWSVAFAVLMVVVGVSAGLLVTSERMAGQVARHWRSHTALLRTRTVTATLLSLTLAWTAVQTQDPEHQALCLAVSGIFAMAALLTAQRWALCVVDRREPTGDRS